MLNKGVINLATLRENAIAIKNRLNPCVKFCAVCKADAYGHGAEEVSNAIYDIVDCFAVALPEEGVKLRQCGIKKDILVLTPIVKYDIDSIVRHNLTACIDSLSTLKDVERVAKRYRTAVKVHIAINTGMNRFGMDDLDELKSAFEFVKDKKYIAIEGIFSHFYNPQDERATKTQLKKFLLAKKVAICYNKDTVCHVSASGGLLRGIQLDMVRVGILLYGYKPFKCNAISVKPVLKVYTHVIRTRRVKKNENVLYGDYPALKDEEYCILRWGYADGLFRKETKGKINNACMDAVAYRLNGTRKNAVRLPDADALAKNYDTISYEILTKITMRLRKEYIR
ncbi:MAG: alanine racemase [Clostridia bacterium]|nr:alanine racemase [Clostridia bacterium]